MRPNCDRSLISSASDCTNARLPFDATILCGALELKFLIDGVSRSLRGNRFCSSSRSTNSIHPSQIEVIWRLLNKLYPCERCHGGRGRVSCMPPATPANPVEPSQPSQDKQAPCEPRVRERVPRRGETRASRVRSAFQKFAKFSEPPTLTPCRLLWPVATLPVAAGTWWVCVDDPGSRRSTPATGSRIGEAVSFAASHETCADIFGLLRNKRILHDIIFSRQRQSPETRLGHYWSIHEHEGCNHV